MSGLFSALSTNAKALQIHGLGAEITGKNLANINNPDYARQRVNVTNLGSVETPFGPMSMGLTVEGLSHSRDRLLDAALLREVSNEAKLAGEYDLARQLETALGESIDRSDSTSIADGSSELSTSPGLFGAVGRYFEALDGVASNPSDPSQRDLLFKRAEALIAEFRAVDTNINQAIADGTDLIQNQVGRVNEILKDVADLNRQITRFELQHPQSAVDLRDKRQSALEELAQYTDFRTVGNDGTLQVIFTAETSGTDLVAVDGQKLENTLTMVTADTFQMAGSNVSMTRGSIHGISEAITSQAVESLAEVNELAAELVTRVNTAFNPGSNPDYDFFEATGLTAATISVDNNMPANFRTNNTGDASDSTLILNAAKVGDDNSIVFAPAGGDSFTGDFRQYASQIASNLGTYVSSVERSLENQSLVTTHVRAQRDSISAVSMDEEVANLVKYQRAFQASARVISVIDSLLEVVVNGLKR